MDIKVEKSGESLAVKRQEELAFYFDKYLKTIKPVINNFTSSTNLFTPSDLRTKPLVVRLLHLTPLSRSN